ncbi:ADAMTS-like protein 5 [Ambystoma mexicanum]|uniref:ADAMTS-like protein 5 n=1 Tax=Ambystoma mexicanum TaxID=8296 RepID=UPI0037E8EA24
MGRMPRSCRLTAPGLLMACVIMAFQIGPTPCQLQRGPFQRGSFSNSGPEQSHPLGFGNEWSEWRSWSPCSRTCGGGVAVRTRQCIIRMPTGQPCPGEQRQYRVCHTQECSSGSTDFRQLQCSAYDKKAVVGNRLFKWVPFNTGSSTCELSCLAEGHHFYYSFGRVLDGTRCQGDTQGICINGRCLHIGCDLILGSEMKNDICGVCGGSNATCRHHHNVYSTEYPTSGIFGYSEVTVIPAGATHIKVTDNSKNYLALQTEQSEYVLNGNWEISTPGTYNVSGTNILYHRNPANQESIEVVGPTNEDLHIMILFTERNPGIDYEYWLANDQYNYYYADRSPLLQNQQAVTVPLPPTTARTSPVTSPFVWRPVVPVNQRPQPRLERDNMETNRLPESHRPGHCGKCKKIKGRQNKARQYCQQDFVFQGRILGKKSVGKETRYDVQVVMTYKNNFPIVRREYIWVPNICDCPHLIEKREYILMARRHVNYENTLNRILLEAHSFVRPFRPKEDKLLRGLGRECSKYGLQSKTKYRG